MKPSIVVVGSTNTDMVIKTERLPSPGETVLGGTFFMNQGGKGANQAVAAKRLGGNVTFISTTGNDIFGRESLKLFRKEGLNIDYMISDPLNPSGVALITIDKKGENCIVVAPGANARLFPDDLKVAIKAICSTSIVLMQLEIPLETVNYVAALAKSNGVNVILNPAPACELPLTILRNISIITPNKKEAEILSGIKITDITTLYQAAEAILQKGIETVIITLGSGGAFICTEEIKEIIKAPKVNPVDTTGAGDVFNGALALAITENRSLIDAVTFACHAAALSVTKFGALSSAPFRNEADTFFECRSKEEIK